MVTLIIGKNSQIGKELINLIKSDGKDFLFLSSSELDLLNKDEIIKEIKNCQPTLIINFAAYTDVDGAENNKDLCFRVNADGPLHLSEAAKNIGANLIHISTDYVFGEQGEGPFFSDDKTLPINVYGSSKLKGEQNILNNNLDSIIIRTSALFSSFNKNFVKNITHKILNGDDLRVVSDQKISLTFAGDLAKFIYYIITNDLLDDLKETNRIIHFTNIGDTNWHEVASFIKDHLKKRSLITSKIIPISSNEWKSDAKRSHDTRLGIDTNLFNSINVELLDWKSRVSEVVDIELSKLGYE